MRKYILIAVACVLLVGIVLALTLCAPNNESPTPSSSETLPTLDESNLGEWA